MGEETPDQRVARLQRELADAKVSALQAELAEAQQVTGAPGGAVSAPVRVADAEPGVRLLSGLSKRFAPAPPSPGELAPAPRAVPFAFKAMALPWSWWTAWALFMIAIAPIALWITLPIAGVIVAPVTVGVILVLRLRRERTQLALLKWGEPATVTNADVASVGTYYSGVTYQNVRLAQAHGWQVTREWYSGPSTATKITYELGGNSNALTLHGLAYDNGVILADKRKPSRALCISSFAYDLDRDATGNWVGHMPPRVVVGSILMMVLLVGWTAAMVLVCGAAA